MCIRRLCITIVVLSMFHLLSSLTLILWYMNLMNNGQMDRGNENPTQHLPWWLRKNTKKPQSGWPAPGLEPGTSRMRVSCVTTEPPRSVFNNFASLSMSWFSIHTWRATAHFWTSLATAFDGKTPWRYATKCCTTPISKRQSWRKG